MGGAKKDSPGLLNAEAYRRNSGRIRLMQRPLLGQRQRSTAAAVLEHCGDARWKKDEEARGGKERDPRSYL